VLHASGAGDVSNHYTQGGLIVPYITLWSREQELTLRLEKRHGPHGAFLGHVDEDPYDRDTNGALWARYSLAHGKGSAQFKFVHPLRQRNAMLRRLCQVCGTPVLDTDHERELFVLKGIGHRQITDGDITSAPPVCKQCAPIAVRDCPHLKTSHTAAWVTRTVAWGITGTVYDLDTLRPVPGMEMANVSYLDPLIKQVLACRMVESLHGCAPINPAILSPPEPVTP
jgi:hypothetical protein